MNFEFRKFYGQEMQGSIGYGSNINANQVLLGANNGLSVFTPGNIAQLGGPAGAAGAAALLNNREIPLNNFSLAFSGIGQSPTAVPIFQESATMVNLGSTPDMLIQDSTGAEQGRIRFNGSVGGDAGDIYMGRLAGNLMTTPDSRMLFGWRTGELMTGGTGLASTGFGYEVLRLATGNNNTGFGSQALHNITTGTDDIGIGKNVMLLQTLSVRCIGIGNFAGPEFGAQAFTDNIWIGHGAGLTAASTTFVATGNVIIGSTALQNGGGGYGNNNLVAGFAAVLANSIGNNNVLLGAQIVAGAAFNNVIALGQGLTVSVSNVAALGRSDQNTVIGQTSTTVDPGSRLLVNGAFALPIFTTAVSTGFDNTTHTGIFNGASLTATIAAANSGLTGRIYVIVNQNATTVTTSQNYRNFSNTLVNTIAANSAIAIQSNGTDWFRIL